MSQFDAKVIYIKGEENTVADALSHLPSSDALTKAETMARHPYDFCEDDDSLASIASIMMPELCGPWETATRLSSRVPFPAPICTTLEITADKIFLEAVKLVILKMHGVKLCTWHHLAGPNLFSMMAYGTLGIGSSFPGLGIYAKHYLFWHTMFLGTSALTRLTVPCETHITGLTCGVIWNWGMWLPVQTVNGTNRQRLSHMAHYTHYQYQINGVTPLR